jgi:hypothetical protein
VQYFEFKIEEASSETAEEPMEHELKQLKIQWNMSSPNSRRSNGT